jgi:hypothetical protein
MASAVAVNAWSLETEHLQLRRVTLDDADLVPGDEQEICLYRTVLGT